MVELIKFLWETLSNLLNWVNKMMIALIDGALHIWPSTPPMMRPSSLWANLQIAAPGAPWWMLGDVMQSVGVVLGVVIGWKVAKMVRG